MGARKVGAPRFVSGRVASLLQHQATKVGNLRLLVLLAMALIIALPFFASVHALLLIISALIFGLFALSLNFLVGTTGLISFGHAAYFGLGAYAYALLIASQEWPAMIALAVAPLIGALGALIAGVVALRATELYFALLTLGIAQLFFVGAVRWSSLTGGTDGLHGRFSPPWAFEVENLYWFVVAVVALCTVLLLLITRSPFGQALQGIRENRRRAEFSGLWVKAYELAAFVVAGAFAAIAGALFVIYQNQAIPGLLHWTHSALALIMVLLGGIAYLLGPLAGAFFYTFLNDALAGRTAYWDVMVGITVIVVALIMPGGVAGGIRAVITRASLLFDRSPGSAEGDALSGNAGAPLETREPTADSYEHGEDAADASRESYPSRIRREGSSDPLLRIIEVSKRFGGLAAVDDASLDVYPGEVHAIIGPNGAGKTTLFNLITGLLPPDQGQVLLGGEDITGLEAWKVVKRGVGRSFQQADVFWLLSAHQNVVLSAAAARGATLTPWGKLSRATHSEAAEILARLDLTSKSGAQAEELSHGDQRLLEIAMALAVGAKLLLLDEPTAGLSAAETRTTVETMRRLAREHSLTLLFIEHDMDVVFDISDWITVLHEGRVIADGIPADVREDVNVRRAYLG